MQQCWDADPLKRPTMPAIRLALENIMLESAIEAPSARAFWSKYYGAAGVSVLHPSLVTIAGRR